MAKSALRLDTRRALKDGTYPVRIKVGYGTNLYLPTGIWLARQDWDDQQQVCIGPGARKINCILEKRLLQVSNRLLDLKGSGCFSTFTRPQLRQMLTDLSLTAPTIGIPSVGDYFDRIMALKAGSTYVSYDQTRKKLSAYCGNLYELRFSALDYPFFEGFIRFMDGYKRNSISRRLKDFKAVIRYAQEDGVAVNPAYRKVDSRGEEDTPLRALPVETMRRLIGLTLTGREALYRDAFLLSFLLIGINPVDMKKLTRESVVNGRIHYKRSKTGKNYSIKIEPEAQAIMDRYPGSEHLLCYADDYKCFAQNCNAFLSSFEKGVTLYWARYSWANYAVDLDIPKDTISEALGHEHGAKITGVYIKYSTDKIDAANRAVIDYVWGKASANAGEPK